MEVVRAPDRTVAPPVLARRPDTAVSDRVLLVLRSDVDGYTVAQLCHGIREHDRVDVMAAIATLERDARIQRVAGTRYRLV